MIDTTAEIPATARKNSLAMGHMFDEVARRYDLANKLMSLGRDRFWREASARRLKVIDAPGRLLDLAAGTGDQIVASKKARPDLEAVGLDISPAMMELAAPKFEKLSPPKPEIIAGDALDIPFADNNFDSVSISFGLRNISARNDLYKEVLRVLKPGGRFVVLDMYHDRHAVHAPLIYFYLKRVVPLLGGRIASRQPEAYRYLISSILAFPQPGQLIEEMAAAGFSDLNYQSFTFNTVMLLWGHKPLGRQ